MDTDLRHTERTIDWAQLRKWEIDLGREVTATNSIDSERWKEMHETELQKPMEIQDIPHYMEKYLGAWKKH